MRPFWTGGERAGAIGSLTADGAALAAADCLLSSRPERVPRQTCRVVCTEYEALDSYGEEKRSK